MRVGRAAAGARPSGPALVVVSDYAWPAGGAEQFIHELLWRSVDEFACSLLTWPGRAPVPDGLVHRCEVEMGDIRCAWSLLGTADAIVVVTSFNIRLLARLATEFVMQRTTPTVTVVQTSGHSDGSSPSTTTQERWLGELTARSADVVAVSQETADALVRSCGGDSMACPVVIENGARLVSRRPRPRARTCVSFIGRPLPQKGFHHFERLARDLAGCGLRFAANTVSIAPTRPQEGISYSYCLNDDELVRFFEETDLLVVPYLRADGSPLAVLEALNCGVPVMGFDAPGVGSLLRRHGQTVLPPTYEALRDAVGRWRIGDLTVQPPAPGAVPDWDAQIGRHLALLRRAVGG